jgi:hypothetical protein
VGQVTIYLDNETEKKLRRTAKSSQLSVSKWIAGIINEKIKNEWPQDIIDLAGSWKSDFPPLEEIRSNMEKDITREDL